MPKRGRTRSALIGLVLSVLLAAGWGMPDAGLAYDIAAVPDPGTLTGSVKFTGVPPRLDPIPVKKNQDVCGQSVANEALVLDPNRGVRGSVILVEGVRRGKKAEGELILDNARCFFVPHVSAVMVGAPAKIRNSDPVQHNAHGFLGARPIFNLPLSFKGRVVDVTSRLKQPGVVKVLCDVHTHMFAWIVAHDSPYFAVTDEKGNFRIDGIPPGKYTITMWHEGFLPKGSDKDGRPIYDESRVTREVTVPRGGSVSVDFELK
ncbi:MAG: carboxypeptidase regulatory-like domain-containing protein [Candidatus Rokubacteria bacterium]|nr:carboxypeptidase regulatory-like domain-containing protein [Candidatus Rokubacteria bacterium]